jgi:phosphosulfolactate synthase (CoM biosynthesis protein A)
MSNILRILCFHDGIIVNTDNDITYNSGNHEFLIVTSDMSLNELLRILCDRLGYNIFEIEVKITLRMLQTRVNQARYIGVK